MWMMRRLGRPGSPQHLFLGGWRYDGVADNNDAIVVGLIIIISLKWHAAGLMAQEAGHMEALVSCFFF